MSRSTLLRAGVYGLSLLALALHFMLAAIVSMPQNSVSVHLDLAKSYLVKSPFAQQWEFFGPNPPIYDTRLYVTCHQNNGNEQQFDLTESLNANAQRNRISNFDRLRRTSEFLISDYLNALSFKKSPTYKAVCANTATDECREIVRENALYVTYTVGRLQRIASFACNDLTDNIRSVSMTIGLRDIKPWSRRWTREPRSEQLVSVQKSSLVSRQLFGVWKR